MNEATQNTTSRHRPFKVVGQLEIGAMRGQPEWDAYEATSNSHQDRGIKGRKKEAVRQLIKRMLPALAAKVIDFIRYPGSDRIRVNEYLFPRKRRVSQTADLTEEFKAALLAAEAKREPVAEPKAKRQRGVS